MPLAKTNAYERSQQIMHSVSGFCKGYCGQAEHRAECRAERGTSRGSEEERIRIHLQVRPNIQSNGYKG